MPKQMTFASLDRRADDPRARRSDIGTACPRCLIDAQNGVKARGSAFYLGNVGFRKDSRAAVSGRLRSGLASERI